MGKAGAGRGLGVKMSALGVEQGQKSSATSAPCTIFWRQEGLRVRLYPRGAQHLQLCREAADCYLLSCPLRREPGIPSAMGLEAEDEITSNPLPFLGFPFPNLAYRCVFPGAVCCRDALGSCVMLPGLGLSTVLLAEMG